MRKTSLAEIIGSRIKSIRKKRNLTKAQICKLVDIDEISLEAYENGVDEPTLEEIKQIATILNISTDYIFGRIDD